MNHDSLVESILRFNSAGVVGTVPGSVGAVYDASVTSVENDRQRSFEAFSQARLQAALDFCDGSEDVSDIWIYTSMYQNAIVCQPVFRAQGEFLEPGALEEKLRPVGGGRNRVDTLSEEFLDAGDEFYDAFEDQPDDRPTRVIIHYSVADQAMNADFSYEHLDLSNKMAAQDIYDAWLARLTGVHDGSA